MCASPESRQFFSQLPDGCPPDDAYELDETIEVYYLIYPGGPTPDDFRSRREKFPNRDYSPGCPECGLSVFTDEEDARQRIRNKDSKVFRYHLHGGQGLIKQTGQTLSHYTWWPFSDWDAVGGGEAVDDA